MMQYFSDPILRAPVWGCMLMCLSASLMGVVVFLRKTSLLAEALSHASYPGVVLAMFVLAGSSLSGQTNDWMFLVVLLGALISSFLALQAIEWLKNKRKVISDTALCFVLSLFFGVGIVASSALQSSYPSWSKQVHMLLFGQAATMTDVHIVIYGVLAFFVVVFLLFAYRPIHMMLFDSAYASSSGVRVQWVERIFFAFLLLSVVVGMRSVGMILMSGMLVAPAVAARQYTNRLSRMFILAGLFGVASAFLGYVLSVEGSLYWSTPTSKCSLPTGPLIVLVGVLLALGSLCFAPQRGVVFRLIRVFTFHLRCLQENILKGLWKRKNASLHQLQETHLVSFVLLRWVLWRMIRQGWLRKETSHYELTGDGYQKAAAVVRLHRLWEVYLTDYLDKEPGCVHRNAEEMEHILTPDLERRLTELLSNPQKDPHHQPIPDRKLL
ncbi:MAG: iron chelate uptake ABC transporter family permease subunit [Chlamydiales bacterium]|nr:iron chelate uptake ABC transporter family permease subunit [Chlamydiales bacterium]